MCVVVRGSYFNRGHLCHETCYVIAQRGRCINRDSILSRALIAMQPHNNPRYIIFAISASPHSI